MRADSGEDTTGGLDITGHLDIIMAYIVMALQAWILCYLDAVNAIMAYRVMTYVVMAYIVMAYVVMAYTVMAYTVMV